MNKVGKVVRWCAVIFFILDGIYNIYLSNIKNDTSLIILGLSLLLFSFLIGRYTEGWEMIRYSIIPFMKDGNYLRIRRDIWIRMIFKYHINRSLMNDEKVCTVIDDELISFIDNYTRRCLSKNSYFLMSLSVIFSMLSIFSILSYFNVSFIVKLSIFGNEIPTSMLTEIGKAFSSSLIIMMASAYYFFTRATDLRKASLVKGVPGNQDDINKWFLEYVKSTVYYVYLPSDRSEEGQ